MGPAPADSVGTFTSQVFGQADSSNPLSTSHDPTLSRPPKKFTTISGRPFRTVSAAAPRSPSPRTPCPYRKDRHRRERSASSPRKPPRLRAAIPFEARPQHDRGWSASAPPRLHPVFTKGQHPAGFCLSRLCGPDEVPERRARRVCVCGGCTSNGLSCKLRCRS